MIFDFRIKTSILLFEDFRLLQLITGGYNISIGMSRLAKHSERPPLLKMMVPAGSPPEEKLASIDAKMAELWDPWHLEVTGSEMFFPVDLILSPCLTVK